MKHNNYRHSIGRIIQDALYNGTISFEDVQKIAIKKQAGELWAPTIKGASFLDDKPTKIQRAQSTKHAVILVVQDAAARNILSVADLDKLADYGKKAESKQVNEKLSNKIEILHNPASNEYSLCHLVEGIGHIYCDARTRDLDIQYKKIRVNFAKAMMDTCDLRMNKAKKSSSWSPNQNPDTVPLVVEYFRAAADMDFDANFVHGLCKKVVKNFDANVLQSTIAALEDESRDAEDIKSHRYVTRGYIVSVTQYNMYRQADLRVTGMIRGFGMGGGQ